VDPDAGKLPVTFKGSFGDAQDHGGLLDGEAAEEAELDDFDEVGVNGGEFFESGVEGEEVGGGVGCVGIGIFIIEGQSAADGEEAFGGFFPGGAIDEYASHGQGGGGEKMGVVVELGVGLAHETETGLVDEGGGLKGESGGLFGNAGGGEPAEFVVDQGEELLGGRGIAVTDGDQEARGFAGVGWAPGLLRGASTGWRDLRRGGEFECTTAADGLRGEASLQRAWKNHRLKMVGGKVICGDWGRAVRRRGMTGKMPVLPLQAARAFSGR